MTGTPCPAAGEWARTAGDQRLRHGRPDVPRGAVTARDGILLVDKPAGLTSHDVVALVRRMGATRKVGHAGTLDPMATGLLVLGVGRATRLLTYLAGADKTYEATVRLGQETRTEDAEGEVVAVRGCPAPERWDGGRSGFVARLAGVLGAHTGPIMQVPSAVSAIKVDGVRSYTRVREGQQVDLPERAVTIHALGLRGLPRAAVIGDGTSVVDVDLDVSCSSGTYVRALARDIGTALGTGAHLTALRRTSVGPFAVTEARTLDALATAVTAGWGDEPPTGLDTTPLALVARRCFPALGLSETEARALRHGQSLPGEVMERVVAREGVAPSEPGGAGAGAGPHGPVVAGFAPDGELVALLATRGGRARPVLVLAPA